MPDEVRDEIETNVSNPRRVSADGVDAEGQPLRDQIEADRYLSGVAAVDASKTRGLRLSVFKPGGATGCSSS